MKPIRLASVALNADPSAAANPTVWVEVTCEGDYKGYPGGGFKFDTTVFGQIVRNFRAHPAYKIGADGYGSADVVPWDFNHASEMPPTDGSVPGMGAPAQGWAQDLDVRLGPSGAQLWAKTRWLEPARTYVKNGQYKWASVTVIFDARDPHTGANMGCLLTSIALTNTPFVEGMSELVAAQRGGARLPAAGRMQLRWPTDVSAKTPQARTLLASLAAGAVRVSTDDGDDYHAGCVDDPRDEERVRLAREALKPAPRQLAKGMRVRLPGDVSRNTPAARAVIASLAAAGVEVVSDDPTFRAPGNAPTNNAPAPIDASAAPGRNPVEKAIAAMCSAVPGFDQLTWEEKFQRAVQAMKAGAVSA